MESDLNTIIRTKKHYLNVKQHIEGNKVYQVRSFLLAVSARGTVKVLICICWTDASNWLFTCTVGGLFQHELLDCDMKFVISD